MDNESNNINNNSNSNSNTDITEVVNYRDMMKRHDEINAEIRRLQSEDEKLSKKITSFSNKINQYVQEALEIAYTRLDMPERILFTLAKYDRYGIFLYFKHRTSIYDNCAINNVLPTKSLDAMLVYYGCDGVMLVPMEMFPSPFEQQDPKNLADNIVDLCRKTIANLQEQLKEAKFK